VRVRKTNLLSIVSATDFQSLLNYMFPAEKRYLLFALAFPFFERADPSYIQRKQFKLKIVTLHQVKKILTALNKITVFI